eukprot:248023-Pyramimonas_sp.AAC.1
MHDPTVREFGSAFAGGCVALFKLPDARFNLSPGMQDLLRHRAPTCPQRPPRTRHPDPLREPQLRRPPE